MRASQWLVVGACVVGMVGCAEVKRGTFTPLARGPQREAPPADALVMENMAKAPPAGGEAKPAAPPAKEEAAPSRKIIHTAYIDLIVTDFEAAQANLLKLVAESKGYIANSNVIGSAGTQRSANWTVRVPVDGYPSFVAAAAALGETQTNRSDAQDVTDQYVDTEAFIRNKQVEEKTLNRLLEEKAGKLDDVLKLTQRITEVRGEIERAQGRLQVLGRLSALSTVNISMREVKNYVPPTAPTFAATIARTFGDSTETLAAVGRGLLLAAVWAAPWAAVLAVVGVPLWLVTRRRPRAEPPAAQAG
jgi:hypothetical protein